MAQKIKILVAEDDKFLRKLMEKKLEAEGYKLILAVDGDEALKMVRSANPDLVLLDLIMPNKNGFEVLQEMQSDSKLKAIPVIIVSNLGQKENIDRGLKGGAKDYIIKADTSIDDVVAKIKTYVGRR